MKLRQKIAVLATALSLGGAVTGLTLAGGSGVAVAEVNAPGATFNGGNPLTGVGGIGNLEIPSVDVGSIITIDYDPTIVQPYGFESGWTDEDCTAPAGLACNSFQDPSTYAYTQFGEQFQSVATGGITFEINVTDPATVTGCVE